MASTHKGKDVIYVDIDDEITALIDHVRSSEDKIVALVLPKRAAVLQSIVNMKLLKRTADDAKKHLVLITSESTLMPLAGAVGMYVAKSLQSRPTIPDAPKSVDLDEDVVESVGEEPDIDMSKPVGDYMAPEAAGAATTAATKPEVEDEVIDLSNEAVADDTDEVDDKPSERAAVDGKSEKPKKNKKLAVPNFNKFRLGLLLAGLALVAIIALWYVMYFVMPKSNVAIKTDSSSVAVNTDITLVDSLDAADVKDKKLPASRVTSDKTTTKTASSTGQRDKGDKATGSVTLSLTDCSKPIVTVPAGTGVSSNGLVYITAEKLVLMTTVVGGQCKNGAFASDTVKVTAQTGGEKYNIDSGAKFTVAGYSNLAGVGTKMSGGTSEIVQILTQADIDGAKQQLSSDDTAAIKTELKQKLEGQGYYAVDDTFATLDPAVTASAKAGDEVASVTVTQKATYSMFGFKEDDLKKIVDEQVADKIDKTKQKILDYGIKNASFKLQNQSDKDAMISFGSNIVAGSALNVDELKKQIAGKKANAAEELINQYPGVTEVKVTYSPFWVKAVPKDTKKIKINVEMPPAAKENGKP